MEPDDLIKTTRRAKKFKWKWENSTSKLYFSKHEEWESACNSCKQYDVELIRLFIGYTRLIHGHLISRNDQLTFRNEVCGNQKLTIKHCLQCIMEKQQKNIIPMAI